MQWHQLDHYPNNLHHAPDRKPYQFFTGYLLFLMPKQQCQRTERTKFQRLTQQKKSQELITYQ